MMEDDKVVVMYKGKILRESDLKFLKGPCYITHGLIGAYFVYLETQTDELDKIVLAKPMVAFVLSNYAEIAPVQQFLHGSRFRDKELILFPVSNATDLDGFKRGSHWSLLVYDRNKNLYSHFDSSSGRKNKTSARKIYRSTRSCTGSSIEPEYEEVITPGQTNKYDGGLYVMKMASVICELHSNGRKVHGDSHERCDCVTAVINRVHPSLETEMRMEVLRLVNAAREISNPSEDRPATMDEEHVRSTMDKEVVVRYKGNELRKSDLEFLKGPCYVTDRLIDFYFRLLSEKFDFGNAILLVPPSISRWLTICKEMEQITEFAGHLDFPSRQLVLFPVNNDMALYRVESTQPHTNWSLLLYNAMTGLFLHLNEKRRDTFLNAAFTAQLYKKVKSLVSWKIEPGQEQPEPPKIRRVMTAELAKRFNKYDSGVHVLAMAKIICEWYMSRVKRFENEGPQADLPTYLLGMDVSVERNTRLEIKNAIERITGKDYKELLQ